MRLALALALGLAAGCPSSAFVCTDDTGCEGLAGGTCEANGYCSVPDPECPSMRRYAPHSGSLSNECVGEDVADGGATEASDDLGSSDDSSGGTTSVMTSVGSGLDTGDSTGDLDPDLVLHLPFEEDFAAISGAVDLGPFGLDAECQEIFCPTTVEGVHGNAARFDGNQRLEVHGADPLDLTEGLTLAVWVRDLAPDPLATRVIFSRLLGNEYAASYELEFFESTITCAVASLDTQALAQAPYEPYPEAPWIHLAVVVDGSMLLLYRDAELVASEDGAFIDYQEAPLVVGADQDGGDAFDDYFIGELDDLMVFARPLAPAELEALVAGEG